MFEAKNLNGGRMVVLTEEEFEALQWERDTAQKELAALKMEREGRIDTFRETTDDDLALYAEAKHDDAGLPTMRDEDVGRILNGTLHPMKAWREAHNLTQSELAERAGIRPAAVSNIETGKLDARLSTWRKLAAAMGLGIDDIAPNE